LEHYARAIGDSYLRDVTTLRAGEVWDERLGQLIAEADVFQLFWSNRSMVSPFVRTEWERALALDRSNFVRPVYWEEPLPRRPEEDLPPPSLSRVHFQFIGTRSYQPSPEHVARVVIGPTVGSDRTTPQPTQLGGSATNRISSGKGVLFKVRGPRVHLTYPAETYRSQGKLELPFVTGIFADLTGKQDRGHGLKNVHSLR
jgi:hypothetical protein